MASAMGCEVAAISTSKSKEGEAKSFGAQRFIVLSDTEELKKYQGYFDYIVVTAHQEIDYSPLVGMLRLPGTLVIAGIPGESVKISSLDFCMKGLRVLGVPGCSRKGYRQMLDFCAAHKVYPQVEILPFNKINEGFEKVVHNTARFRVVLTW